MIEQLPFLLWPFLGLLCIAAIHVYLGLHVVEREVIFVDLSLAQLAVLGAAVATLWGLDPHDPPTYIAALGFTVLGAAVFSFTRSERGRVPQEAIIGIVYAVAAAATVLILNNAPHGAEHIRDVLVGQLLAVGPTDVLRLAVLYAVLGVLHVMWRKKLLLISADPVTAKAAGVNVKLWDFVFYVTFGLTVTASVELGGVLVVFSFLIVPSVIAMLFAERVGARLAIGWAMAALASAFGMLTSVWLSAPPGASVVCVFGALLILAGIARPLVARRA
ncbi:MAG TPA: iron chelate uptake ABC transporter family permease subunit [Candidatus Eisenbacteria bacterium]|nr:iron chelate uptake ABC transporter family permease subunit [Candidatus Eisenbacteria bacterium]